MIYCRSRLLFKEVIYLLEKVTMGYAERSIEGFTMLYKSLRQREVAWLYDMSLVHRDGLASLEVVERILRCGSSTNSSAY